MLKFFIGFWIGYLVFTGALFLGEQRYSDAIQKCVREQGPNK